MVQNVDSRTGNWFMSEWGTIVTMAMRMQQPPHVAIDAAATATATAIVVVVDIVTVIAHRSYGNETII